VARFILLEEFHLTVFVPRRLPEADCDALSRALSRSRLRRQLRRAARRVLRRYPSLRRVRLTLSR